jgi:hypothetical protein
VRTRSKILALAAVVAGLGIYWFAPQELFLDRRVEEALPTAPAAVPGTGAPSADPSMEPAALAMGAFASLAHETTGMATIVEFDDGSRFLRIEDLETLSGPDLRVYLSRAPADGPQDALDDVFVDLGGLKGNQGDQNYEIPADVDLDDVRSVSIWCRRFSVGFGVAPLEARI